MGGCGVRWLGLCAVGKRFPGETVSLAANRRKILIVDDATAVAETLAMVLSKRGLDVKVAYSAEDAMAMISSWETNGAFIDIMLPGMNGIDFSSALKTMYPECQVELMSGHPGTAQLVEVARREGKSLDVLAKPFDLPEFISIARGRGTTANPGSETF
jgi:DNA-binding NtrC family response regulator